MSAEFLFSQMTLPAELVEDLRCQNPWWERRALPELPPHRRHLVRQIQRRLEWKLAPVVVVRGPRQFGRPHHLPGCRHIVSDRDRRPSGARPGRAVSQPRIVALPLSSLMLLR